MNFKVRIAKKGDIPEIFNLIKELAIFEKEPHAVTISAEDLEVYGFGNDPKFRCFVADVSGKVKAMALVYMRFSTWKGPILHLEDLVVKRTMRGHGLGTALLDEVVKYSQELGVKRVSWEVLDWNEPAIEFYEKKGADVKRDWDVVHLNEEGIKNYLLKL